MTGAWWPKTIGQEGRCHNVNPRSFLLVARSTTTCGLSLSSGWCSKCSRGIHLPAEVQSLLQ